MYMGEIDNCFFQVYIYQVTVTKQLGKILAWALHNINKQLLHFFRPLTQEC